MALDVVAHLDGFFRGSQGFERVWTQIEGFVSATVLKGLRRRLVRGHDTRDDLAARDEIVQSVVLKLHAIRERPLSWFDPAKCRSGARGLWAWLRVICDHEVGTYCRTWRRSGRKTKIHAFSELELNDVVERSGNDREATKFGRLETAELVAIMNDHVTRLPPVLREAIELRFFQRLTDREAALKIGTAASTITKRVQAAIKQLRKLMGP